MQELEKIMIMKNIDVLVSPVSQKVNIFAHLKNLSLK